MAGLLEGHIAAVTGGGSGIGQGICQAYAREGARVIVLDLNMEGANETVGLVTKAGGKASAVKLDVTDRQACKGREPGRRASRSSLSRFRVRVPSGRAVDHRNCRGSLIAAAAAKRRRAFKLG